MKEHLPKEYVKVKSIEKRIKEVSARASVCMFSLRCMHTWKPPPPTGLRHPGMSHAIAAPNMCADIRVHVDTENIKNWCVYVVETVDQLPRIPSFAISRHSSLALLSPGGMDFFSSASDAIGCLWEDSG